MRYSLLYKTFSLFLIIFLFTSCSTYEKVSIDRKINIPDNVRLYDADEKIKPGFKRQHKTSLLVSSDKYLMLRRSPDPEFIIMNAGVREVVRGNYIEAEILFSQVKDIITDGSIDNNLAVLYELTKRKKDAMRYYTRAVVKSPENPEFRSNLLSFINLNNNENRK